MNLFEAHRGTNVNATKDAITKIIYKNVGKYILAQREVNERLAHGKFSKKCKSKKKCTLCQIAKIFKDMNDMEGITKEACKTYKMLFDEEFDIKSVINEMKQEFYSVEGDKKRAKTKVNNIIMPDDTPEEVKKMARTIQAALKESGIDDAQMELIDMSGNNYGLNPDNFENNGEFAKAVSMARQADESIQNGDKTAEEVITEAAIHKAEEEFIKTPSMKVRKGDLN